VPLTDFQDRAAVRVIKTVDPYIEQTVLFECPFKHRQDARWRGDTLVIGLDVRRDHYPKV